MGTAGAPSQCLIMLRRLWHQTGPVLTLTLMAEMNRRATNVEKSVEELEFLSGVPGSTEWPPLLWKSNS